MTFEDWFNSIEGYALLGERFYADLDSVVDGTLKYDIIVKWLKAAYETGYEEGQKDVREDWTIL